MHIFTSVTANYIPKARVLAQSVKKHQPDAVFHLLLSDAVPDWLDMEHEDFDHLIHIEDLGIDNLQSWIFKHSLVELCTAVKGYGFQYILKHYQADKVIYLDPDIVVFSPLDSLDQALDEASILLTPHQCVPESDYAAIIDNEICSLKHGVFNLGFLAIANDGDGNAFVDWWAARLGEFCYDDIAAGLFTDQRWVDLAPCFFERLKVLRAPIYNVCTWNLSNRQVAGSLETGITVNGQPLCFYHFSGFDSGAQEVMLNKYGSRNPALKQLRAWYLAACDAAGQQQYGTTPCCYNSFANGQPITRQQRVLYRSRRDLIDYFPDPFCCDDPHKSYCAWYAVNADEQAAGLDSTVLDNVDTLRDALISARSELNLIKNSRTWRVLRAIEKVSRPLRKMVKPQ